MTKVFRVQDAVEADFPGTRTIIRTYREVWQTRKTGKKDKHGRDIRKCAGKPTIDRTGLWAGSPLPGHQAGRVAKFLSEVQHWNRAEAVSQMKTP